MSKIEKSLELNITHEILNLADSFWSRMKSYSLYKYWKPSINIPFIYKSLPYATGLPINLEGKSGGYDVCITSPSIFNDDSPRLLYMQFKSGKEKLFNSNPQSQFYGDKSNPNIHVEFEINNNKKRNQHALLRDLASKSGNSNAVVYVFPRIVNNEQLMLNTGKLLSKTTFLSISDIDHKALLNGIKIDDGNIHKYRTSYNDWKTNEINLLLLLLGEISDPGKQIGEIFAIRMYRSLKLIRTSKSYFMFPIKEIITFEMANHIVEIGEHFLISTKDILESVKNLPNFYNIIKEQIFENRVSTLDLLQVSDEPENSKLFFDIIDSLSLYYNWITENTNNTIEDIPSPPSNYTIKINPEGLRFNLNSKDNIHVYQKPDLNTISYSLF